MHGRGGPCEVFICDACGTGETRPIVAEADLADFYPHEYAPHLEHSAPKRGLRASIGRAIEQLHRWRHLRALPISERPAKPGTMLDVGCGRGDLGALMISQGWKVAGIEPSPDACAVATGQGLEMFTGTLGDVELGDRQFDIVSFQHSFEHVFDPNVDLDRVLPHLAQDGLLMITVPNFGSWQRRVFGADWYHLDLPRHRYHYTEAGLRALLERHGMRVTNSGTTTSPFGVTGSATYRFAGGWIYDTPAKNAAISAASIALHPLNLVFSALGGGDYLNIVAQRG